jgi:hypothetical protein
MLSACESSQLPWPSGRCVSRVQRQRGFHAAIVGGRCVSVSPSRSLEFKISGPHHARWLQSECRSLAYAGMRSLNRHFYADRAQARDPAGCKNFSENMRTASPTRSNRTDRRRQSCGKHPRYNRLYRAQSSTNSDCHPPQIDQSNPPVRYRCYSTRSSCRRCDVRSLGKRYRPDANR